MTHVLRSLALVAAIAVSATSAVAQAQAPADSATTPGGSGWRTVIYPLYGWLPIFGADVLLPEQPAPPGGSGGVTRPSAETSGNLNSAYAAGFRVERRRLSVQGQFLWAGLSGTVTLPAFEITADTSYGELLGGVRVVRALYIDGGVRHLAVKMTASVLSFPAVTWKPGIWESVLGMTFRPQLSRNVRMLARADVGGIGDDSHRTATATALIEWKPISRLSIGGGYGVLYLRADGTILAKPVHLKESLHGPMVALGIPF